MEKANFGQIVSFLFGIANDCLVDTYDVGDYRKIILPMMVIRRFDAVLEPTKEKVLKMKEQLDAAGITDQDEALCSVAGEAFCNSSPYTLSDLKSRTNQQQLKSDFILYLNGFSQNVQDIIKRFEFRNQIDKLSEHDILGLLISKFTDSSVNLSNRPIYDAKGNLVQPALDNHTMGTVFEEVIRKFNEETNITAGVIKEAFDRYYKTTILSGETDVNKLNDLIDTMESIQVYSDADIDTFVERYLANGPREHLDPILDRAAHEAVMNSMQSGLELFREVQNNPSFRKWLFDSAFNSTYQANHNQTSL